MVDSILKSTSTQFRYGHYDSTGTFIGVFIKGTDLTYDENGALTGGTVNYIQYFEDNFPGSGSATRYYLKQMDVVDVASLSTISPDWYKFESKDLVWDYAGGLMTADWLPNTFTGTSGDDRMFLHQSGWIDAGTGDDWIRGWTSANIIYAGDGNDTVYGGGGGDTVYGGAGNDRIFVTISNPYATYETNTAVGGTGDDSIFGGSGADYLFGGGQSDGGTNEMANGGNDLLKGYGGDDIIEGGSGNDTIYGGDGIDGLRGGSGADVIFGGAGDDTITGNQGLKVGGADGTNRIYGGAGADWIEDGNGDDFIFGGADSDSILLGDGNDRANGGTQSDQIIVLGGGNKVLWGGGSELDVFYIDVKDSSGTVRIRDFDASDFVILNDGTSMTAEEQFAFFHDNAVQVGTYVLWTSEDGAWSVRFDNTTLDDFALSHFSYTSPFVYGDF